MELAMALPFGAQYWPSPFLAVSCITSYVESCRTFSQAVRSSACHLPVSFLLRSFKFPMGLIAMSHCVVSSKQEGLLSFA